MITDCKPENFVMRSRQGRVVGTGKSLSESSDAEPFCLPQKPVWEHDFPSCYTGLWKHGSDILYFAFLRLQFCLLFWFQYFLKWAARECTPPLPPDMLQLKPKVKGVLGRLGGWGRHGVTESRTILWEVSRSLVMVLLPLCSSLPFLHSLPPLLFSIPFSFSFLEVFVHFSS